MKIGILNSMKNMVVILSFISLLLLIGCTSRSHFNQNLNREWMMVEMEGYTKQELIDQKAKMSLMLDNQNGIGNFSAFVGCNSLSSSVEFLTDNRLKINPLSSTEMSCKNMKLENDFKELITGNWNYHIEGHFLILKNKEGKVLKWIAADWD